MIIYKIQTVKKTYKFARTKNQWIEMFDFNMSHYIYENC